MSRLIFASLLVGTALAGPVLARDVTGTVAYRERIALPDGAEETDPSFHHHTADDLPTYEGGGMMARLIAGKQFGAEAKVKVHSPMFYVHWALQPGAKALLPAEYPERAAYVAQGVVEAAGRHFTAGQMVVFEPGQPVLFTAATDAIVMLLGGEPMDGPRFVWWNFVSSRKETMIAAAHEWEAGLMGRVPGDEDEFIPMK